MKKHMIGFIIAMMGCLVLSGCGAKDKKADKDEAEVNTEAVEEQSEDVIEFGKEDKEEDDSRDVSEPAAVSYAAPVIELRRESRYKRGEDSACLIEHGIVFPVLDKGYAESHDGLSGSLEAVRDEIVSAESKDWAGTIDKIGGVDSYSQCYEHYWKTYIRRVDNDYVSLVTESRMPEYEIEHYSYTSHNFRTETGAEVELSEVVSDEGAFFDAVSQRIAAYIDDMPRLEWGETEAADAGKIREEMDGLVRDGEFAWTIDPQGVTVYFGSGVFDGVPVCATVFFDIDAGLFTDAFAGSEPGEWIMQTPGGLKSCIDLNDDDKSVYIRADELLSPDLSGGSDDWYLSGLYVNCGDVYESFDATVPGGTDHYDVFLVHKDHKTVLLEVHDEYDTAFMNTYLLDGNAVKAADSAKARLEDAGYDGGAALEDADGIYTYYIPTDISAVRVLLMQDGGEASPGTVGIDAGGMIVK
ncbi:MAG: hypothetical protein K6F34_11065 [Lachnospiraceae bacterium]|nr:hypothetical protein [Lachnospiraceae bacterium]